MIHSFVLKHIKNAEHLPLFTEILALSLHTVERYRMWRGNKFALTQFRGSSPDFHSCMDEDWRTRAIACESFEIQGNVGICTLWLD